MATYTQMVDKVLAWSNREVDVLPYSTIKDLINFGVDNAYRTLRIVPLEATKTYDAVTKTEADAKANKLSVPSDAIEFIQLRRRKDDTTDPNDFDVYSPKSDIRSFYQPEVCKYGYRNYTRERGNLVLSPEFEEGDIFELFYYRRLPEVDARYSVNETNNNADLLHYNATSESALITDVQNDETSDVFTKDPDLEDQIVEVTSADATDDLPAGFYLGQLSPNWLRDENEKVILFGALMEAFQYLNEPEQLAMYSNRFQTEIDNLNREEKMRMVLGGNVQTHFSGRLI